MAPIAKPRENIKTKRTPRIIDYPTGDGKPMAETDRHAQLTIQATVALQEYYHENPFVYVAANNFLYYVEGNPKCVVSPDVYVVFGAENRLRNTYKVWEEDGLTPRVIFDFTSKSTRHIDNIRKLPLYEQTLKVDEYFRFDPRGDYLVPRLQGFRLERGYYTPIPMEDGNRLHSRNLELDLVMQNETLRFLNPKTGDFLKTHRELTEQVDELAERARNAEEELARLRAELETLKQQNAAE